MSGEPRPGRVEVRGTVDAAKALAEYERVKALLPPGVEPTLEDLRRVNAREVRARPAVADAPPEGRITLSRAAVLRFREGWQRGEGHPWKLAGVSEATYLRARHRYGLVPWPVKYRHKMKG